LLRTFSKASGLAGIRIGYAVGPVDIIHGLMTCRFPFNANLVAQAGAMAALDDSEFTRRSKEHNLRELEFLRHGLEGLPAKVPPTQTNFLYIDTEKSATWLFQELQKVGVVVRPVGPGAIRVSTGLREDNEHFLEHFRRLVLSRDGPAA
jgi:histidinol-phosphate aminotransferase